MATEAQLWAMGLSPKDPMKSDVVLKNIKDWTERRKFQTAINNSDLCEDKPEGPKLFATTNATAADRLLHKCNLIIPIAMVSATVQQGNEDGTPKSLAAEAILAQKEGAEWSIENLTYSDGETKYYKHMKVASEPEVYIVPKYYEYVPIKARNAIPAFKDKFYQKHIGANANLTRDMITVTFVTFKCCLPLGTKDISDEHFDEVHGISGGATDLLPFQEIEVNTTIPFTVPDLTSIETVGPDKKAGIIRSLCVQSVARGVINKTSNRNGSCLNESRSRDFMQELARSSSPTFYGRFKMYLKEEANVDIDESFQCKWKHIESAL